MATRERERARAGVCLCCRLCRRLVFALAGAACASACASPHARLPFSFTGAWPGRRASPSQRWVFKRRDTHHLGCFFFSFSGSAAAVSVFFRGPRRARCCCLSSVLRCQSRQCRLSLMFTAAAFSPPFFLTLFLSHPPLSFLHSDPSRAVQTAVAEDGAHQRLPHSRGRVY